MLRRLLLTTLALAAIVLGSGVSPAFAHNSLESSLPGDGQTLTEQPADMLLSFAKDVPLETLTVTLTDPTGVRTELPGSRHGANAREVLTPLPTLGDGAHTLRWRLVGADGHAITGRVEFVVASAATSSTDGAVAPPVVTSSTLPATTPAGEQGDSEWTTPGWVGWLLRYLGYLGMMVVTGVTIAEAFVWRRTAAARFQRLVAQGLGLVVTTAALQLLVLAADISGAAPWAAFSSLEAAAENPAGTALVIRMAVAVAAWMLLVRARPDGPDVQRDVAILLCLGLLATWSFSGHARSLRWPWLGVSLDVAHHGAAAAWLGGLAIVGAATLRRSVDDESVGAVRRFSVLAARAVGVIVVTGLVQSVRLGGGPGDLLGTTHGRLLVVKGLLLAGMLWLAARNRRLVQVCFEDGVASASDVVELRGAMRRELLIGLAIVGVTASLVVTPPATAEGAASPRPAGGRIDA